METARVWPGFASPTRVRCPDPAPHRPAALASCHAGRASDGDGWHAPEVAANINTTEMGNLHLNQGEDPAIVAFLRTLTDR
jgi:hypothetical protein